MNKPSPYPNRGSVAKLLTEVGRFNQLDEQRSKLGNEANEMRAALREKIQTAIGATQDANWPLKEVISLYREGDKIGDVEAWLAELAALEKRYDAAAKNAMAARPDKKLIAEITRQVQAAKFAEYEIVVGEIVKTLASYCDDDPEAARELAVQTPAAIRIYQAAANCDHLLDTGSFSTRSLLACLTVLDQLSPR